MEGKLERTGMVYDGGTHFPGSSFLENGRAEVERMQRAARDKREMTRMLQVVGVCVRPALENLPVMSWFLYRSVPFAGYWLPCE